MSTPSDVWQREYAALWKESGVEQVDLKKTGKKPAAKRPKTAPPSATTGAVDSPMLPELGESAPAPETPRLPLEQIRVQLGDGCGSTLCATKHNLVFGVGNAETELVFVGEGPGADEDARGEPFVGRAGQLLTKMIQAMGMERAEVYIANVVKCRPPNNRQPLPEEIALCAPFLRLQLASIAPKIVVALGATAASALVGHGGPLGQVRGTFQPLVWDPTILVLPTYHPAYLLRNPPAKKTVWEDLKLVMAKLGKPIPKPS